MKNTEKSDSDSKYMLGLSSVVNSNNKQWLNIIDIFFLTSCCCWVTSVMSDSLRPHRRQPTRMPHPWDSPGKNTGVGCHFLLQCMKVKSESEVAQSCLTLSDPMDCSLPGSSIHGIFPGKSTGVGCHCLLRIMIYLHTKNMHFPFHVFSGWFPLLMRVKEES